MIQPAAVACLTLLAERQTSDRAQTLEHIHGIFRAYMATEPAAVRQRDEQGGSCDP